MTAHAEQIPNQAVDRQESLCVRRGFERPHLSLALAGRLMRDFGAIVLVLRRTVRDGRHHEAVGGRVAAKLVGDQTPWRTAFSFQQLAEEAGGRPSITPPSWSMARQRYCRRPWMLTNSSSRCHVSPICPRRRRSVRAYAGPNVRHHCRIVTSVTVTPRWARRS